MKDLTPDASAAASPGQVDGGRNRSAVQHGVGGRAPRAERPRRLLCRRQQARVAPRRGGVDAQMAFDQIAFRRDDLGL